MLRSRRLSTILLTGATGFVGTHLLPALLDARHEVVALVRSHTSGRELHERLEPAKRERVRVRIADVTRRDALDAVMAGVDAVVHLVAIARDWNGGRDLRRVNTEGTRNVVEAAERIGVRRFIHLGAMGITDDPRFHYASSKARAEALVQQSALDWTVLKPSLMWGVGDGFFRLIALLARLSPGVMPVPGNGMSRFQPIWVGDTARIVTLCLEQPETTHRSFELGGPAYWTYSEITREVLAALGKQRLVVPVPVPLISLVAGVSELAHLPFPVATDQLRQLKLDNIGPLDGVQRAFGFAPRPMNGNLGYLRKRRGSKGARPAGNRPEPLVAATPAPLPPGPHP
jgi:uncharacterized protein YbjT (DUF2867 family)